MEVAVEVEVATRGQITLPEQARDSFGIEEGQRYTLRRLQGGVLLLVPSGGRAAAALNRARKALARDGVTSEDLFAELRRLREADGG